MNILFEYFEKEINITNQITKSYIVDLFSRPNRFIELINRDYILTFADVKTKNSFAGFQQLADYLLWIKSVYPKHIEDDSLATMIGQLSYDKCYKLLNRQWPLYEELADCFPKIVEIIKHDVSHHFRHQKDDYTL